MFNDISWQAYWVTLVVLLSGYYIVIYLLYFRMNLPGKWLRRKLFSVANPNQNDCRTSLLKTDPSHSPPISQKDEDLQVHACLDELTAYFAEAKRFKVEKEELLHTIKKIFSKYPGLQDSGYKNSVGNIIRSEAEHHCSIHISNADLVHVWLGS